MSELDLPEFLVISRAEENNGDYLYHVSIKTSSQCCPVCDSTSINKHGAHNRMVRDLSKFGHRVGIHIMGNRYKCKDCSATFSDELESVEPNGKITLRMKDYIKRESLKRPFLQIAQEFGITSTTVKRIFCEYEEELNKQRVLYAPEILGIDEVHLNKQMRGVFTDIRLGRIIEMTEKRTKIEVISFLQQLPNSQNIKIVTIDMCTTYREAVFEVLPHARVVIDKFHVIKMAVAALENTRKQMNGTISKRERSRLLHLRYLLLANYESLSEEQHLRLKAIFSDYPCFELPYLLKEELREMYKSKTTADAIRLFELWKDHIPSEMTDFVEISKTIYRWRNEIFSYFDCRVTNATTESLNNLVKCIQRQARGYTFEVLRTKVLYGTKATKKAAYSFRKPKLNSSKTMISYTFGVENDLYQTKMLVTGTGTDINELIEVFEDGDF